MVRCSNEGRLPALKAFVTLISSLQNYRAFNVSKAKAISAPTIAPQAIIAFAAAGALCLRLALLLISP